MTTTTGSAPGLTEEDIYNFDTAGFLHLRGVLSTVELEDAAAAVRAAGSDAASLVRYIQYTHVISDGFAADTRRVSS
jgi:hypothetical protein